MTSPCLRRVDGPILVLHVDPILFDDRHRRHLMDETLQNICAYRRLAEHDPAHPAGCDAVLAASGGATLVAVTYRPWSEIPRLSTLLAPFNVTWACAIGRRDMDFRSNIAFRADALFRLAARGYPPDAALALDDADATTWRASGLAETRLLAIAATPYHPPTPPASSRKRRPSKAAAP